MATASTLARSRLGNSIWLGCGVSTTASGPAGALRGGDALTRFGTKLAAAFASGLGGGYYLGRLAPTAGSPTGALRCCNALTRFRSKFPTAPTAFRRRFWRWFGSNGSRLGYGLSCTEYSCQLIL